MELRSSTSSVAGTSKAAALEDEPSTSGSNGSTPVQQQQKEKQLITIYRASLEQCKQLFGATCSVKLQRCDVPTSDAPAVLGAENNAAKDNPSAHHSTSSVTGSCSFSNGDKEKVLPVPPAVVASSSKNKRGKKASQRKSSEHCRVCGKIISKRWFKIHMRKHTGEKRYSCDNCGRSFWNASLLTKHKKTRAQRNGACPLELKKFGGRMPKGAWECKICGKRLKYPDSYLPHIKRHGIKPFKCGVCGKGFTYSYELSKHKRIHSGVWKHSCIFCDKGFHNQDDLFRHLRVHTEEKPYICKVKGCGASYQLLESLRSHQRRIHF